MRRFGVREMIEALVSQLRDTGNRTPLTNAPVGNKRTRYLDFSGDSGAVFRSLVHQGRSLKLISASRRSRLLLESALEPAILHEKLTYLLRQSRTLVEEQGMNCLFLAIGFLRWFEKDKPEIPLWAPLLLVPVKLERNRPLGLFNLDPKGGDMEVNMSLRQRLEEDYGYLLPDFPEAEDWRPQQYYDFVEGAVCRLGGFEVDPNRMLLGFFSFAKMRMANDLEEWMESGDAESSLAGRLLQGRAIADSTRNAVFREDLDVRFPDPRQLGHILDADSSQTQIIAEAISGRNLVVQGPPGTGKSQTIANIIAASVRNRKTVLFVTEKKVALDTVYKRLKKCGLEHMCLELHSRNAYRKSFYRDLSETADLGKPSPFVASGFEEAVRLRDELNRTSGFLHAPDPQSGESLHGVMGKLSNLVESGCTSPGFRIEGIEQWTGVMMEENLKRLQDLADLTRRYGSERDHPWRGVSIRLNLVKRKDLPTWIERGRKALGVFLQAVNECHAILPCYPEAATVRELMELLPVLEKLDGRPQGMERWIRNDAFLAHGAEFLDLCEEIEETSRIRKNLEKAFHKEALRVSWAENQDWPRRTRRSPSSLIRAACHRIGEQIRKEFNVSIPRSWIHGMQRIRELPDRIRRRVFPGKDPGAGHCGGCPEDRSHQDGFTEYWIEVRRCMRLHGRSILRFLREDYRWARKQFKSSLNGPRPSWESCLGILDELVDFGRKRSLVEVRSDMGKAFFGSGWADREAEIESLVPNVEWLRSMMDWGFDAGEICTLLKCIPDDLDLRPVIQRIGKSMDDWKREWDFLKESLQLRGSRLATTRHQWENAGLKFQHHRMTLWKEQCDRLDEWYALRQAGDQVSRAGLRIFRHRLAHGSLEPDQAVTILSYLYYTAVWDRLERGNSALEDIAKTDRHRIAEAYRDMDTRLMSLTANEIAQRHYQGVQELGHSGEAGVLRAEFSKRIRHTRIRKLLASAGSAVQRLKPVFLMSPLSVSQFLQLNGLRFDLLVIDEASQVTLAEGIGSMLRAEQFVIVGDKRQMPPTTFFDRHVGSVEDPDDEGESLEDLQAGQIGDMESIITFCESRGFDRGMLEWHYRSQHPSLIEFSNLQFYNNQLVFPPHPETSPRNLGVSFQFVEGVYSRGGKRSNREEADAIVRHVREHARTRPSLSLGVVALSHAQQEEIANAFDRALERDRELEAFCNEDKEVPFFIKNLENVQGDERDVILISVGHARDKKGNFSQHFGPINQDGGQRRLNVLFTRARFGCRVFASIRHGDIRTDACRYEGPRVLKDFLEFAESGVPSSGREPETGAGDDFEHAIASVLDRQGYRSTFHLGTSSFRIDLAIRHPDESDRYLMAIECDGARYHSSIWARERERLRQDVLESKGWCIHRIWIPDWFYRHESECKRLLAALEQARKTDRRIHPQGDGSKPSDGRAVIKRDAPPESRDSNPAYTETRFGVPVPRQDILITGRQALLNLVLEVVKEEGPVHLRVIAQRICDFCGRNVAAKFLEVLEEVADLGLKKGSIACLKEDEGEFFVAASADRIGHVRDRSAVEDVQVKAPRHLPASEIRFGILRLVRKSVRIRNGDCIREICRQLGFQRTGARLNARIQECIDGLVKERRLVRSGDDLMSGE